MLRLRVRELCQERGMSVHDLRNALGVSLTSARRIWFSSSDAGEGGHLRHIDLGLLEKLMDLFEVDLNALFERVEE